MATVRTGQTTTFNVNDQCVVQLTECGRRILDAHYRSLGLEPPAPTRLKGFATHDVYRAAFWNLMNIFGPHLFLGMTEVPFEKNEITLLP